MAARALECTAQDAVRRASSLTIVPVGGKVGIVAIGSSSTQGAYASSPATTYPAVLQQLLAGHPEVATFEVFNKGNGGESLAQIQARLQRDVLDLKPQLLVLQTGTIDAINAQNGAALGDFRTRLRAVVADLKPKVRILLLNSQHYPTQPANYVAFQDVLEQISAEQDVPLFDRYGLMKSWIDSGKYSFNQILASDVFHPNDFLYRCTAEVVADLVLTRTVKPAAG